MKTLSLYPIRSTITAGIFILLTFCSNAQSPEAKQNLDKFIEGYNSANYEMMRGTMAGPLKLIFTEKNLKLSFGAQLDQLGQASIASTTWKNNNANSFLKYERDTTEKINLGMAFSKKGKIIGLSSTNRSPNHVKKNTHEIPANAKTRIDSLIANKHQVAGFSGCVMVIDNGQPVYERCIGASNYQSGEQLTPSTLFDLASCSKAFTAMGIMLLQQQEKLNIHDPIVTVIPELKKYKGITIEHLLTHTSGIPDYMELFDKYWDKTKFATNEDVVKLLGKYHPKKSFSPGKEFEYSNTGYVLLAVIAARVSKQPFEVFMKNEIFTPLGMSETRIYNTRRSKGEILESYGFGHIYDFRKGTFTIPDSLPEYDYVRYMDPISGDGVVNSNVRDLMKWDAALRQPGLFTQPTLDAAFTAFKTTGGESTSYGYGWEIKKKEGYEMIAEHSGSWPGYTSYILQFRDFSRTIIILSNSEYLFMNMLAHKIAFMME